MSDDRVAQLLVEIRDELRLIRQGQRSAPRDDRHGALLQAIAVAANGAAFSVSELLVHARAEASLSEAIVAACGSLNGRALGRLLRRVEGAELGGVVIERCGEDSDGIIWTAKLRKPRLAIA